MLTPIRLILRHLRPSETRAARLACRGTMCSSAHRVLSSVERLYVCDPLHNPFLAGSITVRVPVARESIMTIEREDDPDATVKMPRPRVEIESEDFDPERTVVREDWDHVRQDLERANKD